MEHIETGMEYETGQEMCLPAWLTKYRPAAALWKVSHGKFEMT